jgi:hypothetical protein
MRQQQAFRVDFGQQGRRIRQLANRRQAALDRVLWRNRQDSSVPPLDHVPHAQPSHRRLAAPVPSSGVDRCDRAFTNGLLAWSRVSKAPDQAPARRPQSIRGSTNALAVPWNLCQPQTVRTRSLVPFTLHPLGPCQADPLTHPISTGATPLKMILERGRLQYLGNLQHPRSRGADPVHRRRPRTPSVEGAERDWDSRDVAASSGGELGLEEGVPADGCMGSSVSSDRGCPHGDRGGNRSGRGSVPQRIGRWVRPSALCTPAVTAGPAFAI